MFSRIFICFATLFISCLGIPQLSPRGSFRDVFNHFGNEDNVIRERPVASIYSNPPLHCGYRNTEGIGNKFGERNNGEAEYGEFPWVIAILQEERMSPNLLTLLCSGSLIHPRVVLTAAHCVQGKEQQLLKVRAGEYDLRSKSEKYPDQDRYVQRIIVHKDYNEKDLSNDIALLFVNKPFTLGENVQPICLPPTNATFDNDNCYVIGWGKDTYGPYENHKLVLKKYGLTAIPSELCENSLRSSHFGELYNHHESFICAGAAISVNCKADGGSPLVCPSPGMKDNFFQAGILTWGDGCRRGVPGVYASVSFLKPWIDQYFE